MLVTKSCGIRVAEDEVAVGAALQESSYFRQTLQNSSSEITPLLSESISWNRYRTCAISGTFTATIARVSLRNNDNVWKRFNRLSSFRVRAVRMLSLTYAEGAR